MKKNFKRTLSLILAVLMVMTVVPFSGMASDEHVHNYVYEVYGDGEHIKKCNVVGCREKEFEVCDEPNATSCNEAPTCSKCGAVNGDPLVHDFTAMDIEDKYYVAGTGDCENPKQYYYSCANADCDAIDTTRTFDGANGECVPGEGVSNNDATCGVDGTLTISCTVCGEPINENAPDEGSALEHNFTKKTETTKYLVPNSVATCDKGAEYYYACANGNCDVIGTEKYFSEVTGNHVFHELEDPDFLKDEATCSKDAVYYKWCSVCTHPANQLEGCEDETFTVVGSKHDRPTTKEDVVDPSAEDEEKYLVANADCLNNALYSKLCKKCGEPMATTLDEAVKEGIDYYEKANTALNPGHRDLTKMELIGKKIEPTCTKKGQEAIYRCKEKDCNVEVGGEIIAANGHAYDTSKALTFKDAECGKNGHYGRNYCPDCNTSYFFDGNGKDEGSATGVAEKTIKAIDHVNKQGGDDLCDNCGTVVKPSETCSCICHKGGFMYIVALILKFFWKLMGTREYCECSTVEEIIKHY